MGLIFILPSTVNTKEVNDKDWKPSILQNSASEYLLIDDENE